MAEALIERGIGATRALVVERGDIIAAHIERDDQGPHAGSIHVGRLASILVPRRRGLVRIGAFEALLEPLPAVTEGALLRVAIVREAIPEAGRPRLAKARIVDGPSLVAGEVSAGESLVDRLAAQGHDLRQVGGFGDDALEAAGWGEAVEAARSGHVAFPGGLLTVSPTPAMTVIDVDGPGEPWALALAAAKAAGEAIVRFDVQGSIGIDFPTLTGKAARTALGEALDAALPPGFERTGVNGFGFVQIVRPRTRASFVEAVRAPGFAALELLRSAGRGAPGPRTLVAHPIVIGWLAARPALAAALERSVGGNVCLQADAALAISGGHVHHD